MIQKPICMHPIKTLCNVGLLIAISATGSQLPAQTEAGHAWATPPGWTRTRGGDGGRILRVTTLNASGPGSFAEALATQGPRTVEFHVAGTINLSGRGLKISEPFLTIAGETAPNEGVSIENGSIYIVTHDVIVRHLRVRATDGGTGAPVAPGRDALSTGAGAYDVIVDHCSFAWGPDENLTASGPRFEGTSPDDWRRNTSHRITFSHNIIAEGTNLKNSKGTLVHDNTTEIAIFGNLYVSNNDRHPLFKGGVRAAFVNNYIHNPGHRIMQFGFVPSQWKGRELQRAMLTMVGNVARKGPSSEGDMAMFEVWPSYGPCDVYLRDNRFFDQAGDHLSEAPAYRDRSSKLVPYHPTDGMRDVDAPPVWPPGLKARPASEISEWILDSAGARPWGRDATDRRFIEEARHGGGKVLRLESASGANPPAHRQK